MGSGQNGTYLSVSIATERYSMQCVTMKRLLPPATGEGWDGGDANCEDTPIPASPATAGEQPQGLRRESDRRAITVIAVEKLSI